MPGIPFPKPVSPNLFAPPANEPSYSQIFADTMGNAATPSDGFDQALMEMAALTDTAFLDEADYSNDLGQIASAASGFGDAAEGALAMQLQPASDATDAALSDYGVLVPPDTTTPTPVTPPDTGPPAPGPAQDCTAPAGANQRTLADMRVGDAALNIELDSQDTTGGTGARLTMELKCGDARVFSIFDNFTHGGQSGVTGTQSSESLGLTVSPVVAGTFLCHVQETNSDTLGTFDWYFTVTVVQALSIRPLGGTGV